MSSLVSQMMGNDVRVQSRRILYSASWTEDGNGTV